MTTILSDERKLVLEMLAGGKISVEDAQRLLAKLEHAETDRLEDGGADVTSNPRPKHLRIVTRDRHARDEINLRIPLGLVRAGLALDSFLPGWVQSRVMVGTSFTDLETLDKKYLRENLDDLDMAFGSEDGESVHIFTE